MRSILGPYSTGGGRTERFLVAFLVWSVVIGTSIWVWVDAKSIGVERGQLKGLADMTPLEWFGCCLILWPVGVLFYLAKRQELKRIADSMAST